MISTLSTNKLLSIVVGPKAPTTKKKVLVTSLFLMADIQEEPVRLLATFVHANSIHTNKCPYSKTNNKRQTTENMVLLNEYENDYHTDNTTKTCEEIVNVVLLNQEKLDNFTFLGQTIHSAILDSEATTVYGKK